MPHHHGPGGEHSCVGKARVIQGRMEKMGSMTPDIQKIMSNPVKCHDLVTQMCDNWQSKGAKEFYDKLDSIDDTELEQEVKRAQQNLLAGAMGHKFKTVKK